MSRALLLIILAVSMPLAGCMTPAAEKVDAQATADAPPALDYVPAEPDEALELVETSILLPGDGVDIHARIVRPAGEGPFPVVAQFTPYTAPGSNPMVNALLEPAVDAIGLGESRFVSEFVRRGYAFAYADVRGTGDSSGCLDLRGKADIADLWHLTEWLGTQDWSSGKVGFIGASYPGSEAHMAGLAGNEHLAAIVPVVASTSFYHYHHNDGVPYFGQHSLGGTNAGYTQYALRPTVNPQHENYASRYAEEAQCPYVENAFEHGGMDQTGAYHEWWQERNLRPIAATTQVPVLMAQGLADWNVKPDHIATWFNDLATQKTLIAGQWGHQYPEDAKDAYGDWWTYVTAFFDTHVKGLDTGMFQTDVAWVQDTDGTWHRSASWPLLPDERDARRLHLRADGALADDAETEAGQLAWSACPRHRISQGARDVGVVERMATSCEDTPEPLEVVLESGPLAEDLLVSGVPLVNLTLESRASFVHLVAVLEVVGKDGEVRRENHGYLNPTYRDGLASPADVPVGERYRVSIDLYPQEDVLQAGERLRLVLRSHDEHRTIEVFDEGVNTLQLGEGEENALFLPLRPPAQQGVRLG